MLSHTPSEIDSIEAILEAEEWAVRAVEEQLESGWRTVGEQ